MSVEKEEGKNLELDYTKLQKIANSGSEVVPAVAQDCHSGAVLIVGYVNDEALKTSIKLQKAVFWSTSRNELWVKGASSGDTLSLVDIRVNCEQNSLLYLVRIDGAGSCHTKDKDGISRHGCYYRSLKNGLLEKDRSYPPEKWPID